MLIRWLRILVVHSHIVQLLVLLWSQGRIKGISNVRVPAETSCENGTFFDARVIDVCLKIKVWDDIQTLGFVELIHSQFSFLLIFQTSLDIDLFLPLEVPFLEEDKTQDSAIPTIRWQIDQLIHRVFMWKIDIPWIIQFPPERLRKYNIHTNTPTIQLIFNQQSFTFRESIEFNTFHHSRCHC